MPRPTHPGPPPPATAAEKPVTYLEAQARASGRFQLRTDFTPQGDQAQAIERLVAALHEGRSDQVLLGVTGSGKTFTVAKVIEAVNRPTLVLSHNKTLAAQLYQEFRSFFPENAVEYFVSYYDYYQPEAYVPQTDTYIEKETSRNEEIDKLRLAASKALFERRDVIVVASVSCIYGLGAPDSYYDMLAYLEVGDARGMPALLAQLVDDAVRAHEPRPHARDLPGPRRRARGRAGVRGHGRPRRVLRRRDREDHARPTPSGARPCSGSTGSLCIPARSTPRRARRSNGRSARSGSSSTSGSPS